MKIEIDENLLMTITSGSAGAPDYRQERIQIDKGPHTFNLDRCLSSPDSTCPETPLHVTKGAYQPGDDGRLTLTPPSLPRPCWFKVAKEWSPGTLHMWGMDSTDLGDYPIGVVEDIAGFIHVVSAEEIRLCKPST